MKAKKTEGFYIQEGKLEKMLTVQDTRPDLSYRSVKGRNTFKKFKSDTRSASAI